MDGLAGLLPYDPETTKFEFVRMLLERQVEILFHTYIADTVGPSDHIDAVIVENKAGRSAIRAKVREELSQAKAKFPDQNRAHLPLLLS